MHQEPSPSYQSQGIAELQRDTGVKNLDLRFIDVPGASDTDCYLTSDGTNLRAIKTSDRWILWTPDGVEREMAHYVAPGWACTGADAETVSCNEKEDFQGWYTTTIRDPRGTSSIQVRYDTQRPNCLAAVWDSERGSQSSPVLSFTNRSDLGSGSIGGITTAIHVRTSRGDLYVVSRNNDRPLVFRVRARRDSRSGR